MKITLRTSTYFDKQKYWKYVKHGIFHNRIQICFLEILYGLVLCNFIQYEVTFQEQNLNFALISISNLNAITYMHLAFL